VPQNGEARRRSPGGSQHGRHGIGVRPTTWQLGGQAKAVAAKRVSSCRALLPLGTTSGRAALQGLIPGVFPSQRPGRPKIPAQGAGLLPFFAPAPRDPATSPSASRPDGGGERATWCWLIIAVPWPDCGLRSLPNVPSGTKAWSLPGRSAGLCRRAGPQPSAEPSGGRASRVPDVPSRLIAPTRQRVPWAREPPRQPSRGATSSDRKGRSIGPSPFRSHESRDLQHHQGRAVSPLLPKSTPRAGCLVVPPHHLRLRWRCRRQSFQLWPCRKKRGPFGLPRSPREIQIIPGRNGHRPHILVEAAAALLGKGAARPKLR